MTKKKPPQDPPQQEQPARIDIHDDEYRGVGGCYVVDPATGKRTRIAGPDVGADDIRPNGEPETETGTEALAHESE